MTETTRTAHTGSAGGSSIDPSALPFDHAAPKKVQLSANYTMAHPPGWPTPPFMTGAPVATLRQQSQVLTSGTQITLLKAEADALIAAGKATAV